MNSKRSGGPRWWPTSGKKLIPGFERDPAAALASRSGVTVARSIDLPPILLMHGTADWRVDPVESLEVAEALQGHRRPYMLHIFDNDVHGILWHWRERDQLSVQWFKEHMVR